VSAATGVSLSGPAAGSVNVASTLFTIALTPAGGTNAGDAVTFTLTGITGTFSPVSPISLSTGTPSATFALTPTAEGVGTITITDAGGLTMGAPLTYTAVGAVPSLQALSGDAVSPVRGAALAIVPNTYAPLLVTIAHCPAPITAASLGVGVNAYAMTLMTKAGLIVDPGTLQSDGTYTANVLFLLIETDTVKLPANTVPYVGQVTATANVGGTSRTIPALDSLAWTSIVG